MMTTPFQTQTVATAIPEVTGETTILIQAAPQTVYDYLVDFTRHPEWVANLSKVTKVSNGPIDVGAIFHAQESAPPVPFLRKLNMMRFFIAGLIAGTKPYSEAEITALENGKRIAWKAGLRKGNGWFNQVEWELLLQPQGQGTKLTQRFRFQPQTATAARMIGAAGEGGIAQACAVSLQRLKTVLEK
jgi:uncharacterized protein YndB with AHSA1/START domain